MFTMRSCQTAFQHHASSLNDVSLRPGGGCCTGINTVPIFNIPWFVRLERAPDSKSTPYSVVHSKIKPLSFLRTREQC